MELVYFDMPGRAEAIRICLHASKQEWTDKRISMADYKEAKSNGQYPTGIPVLTLADGRVFTQSIAMLRFAGKLGDSGLYPSDPFDAMAVDEIIDIAQDMMTKCPQSADVDEKKKLREEYANGKLKSFLAIVEDRFSRTPGPFLLGEKFTIGDLGIMGIVDAITLGFWDYIPKTYVDEFPWLKAHHSACRDSSVVSDYYASIKK